MRKIQILAEELARTLILNDNPVLIARQSLDTETGVLYTALMAAVLDERDRCAKIAEGHAYGGCFDNAKNIAAAIREEPKA